MTDFAIGPGRIQTLIALLGILGFIVVGKDFIRIWMGDGFDDVYIITLILIIPALIPLIESVTNTILDAMMKRMARSIALLGMEKIKQDLALRSMKFMSTILTVQKRNWMSIAQKLILCLILQE